MRKHSQNRVLFRSRMYVGECLPLKVPRLHICTKLKMQTQIWERPQPLATKVSAANLTLIVCSFSYAIFLDRRRIVGTRHYFAAPIPQLSRSARKTGLSETSPTLPQTRLHGNNDRSPRRSRSALAIMRSPSRIERRLIRVTTRCMHQCLATMDVLC